MPPDRHWNVTRSSGVRFGEVTHSLKPSAWLSQYSQQQSCPHRDINLLSFNSEGLFRGPKCSHHKFIYAYVIYADPTGREDEGVSLRPVACWDCGIESLLGHECLLWVLCVVRQKSLCRADHSSRGVLLSVGCSMYVIAEPRKAITWKSVEKRQ